MSAEPNGEYVKYGHAYVLTRDGDAKSEDGFTMEVCATVYRGKQGIGLKITNSRPGGSGVFLFGENPLSAIKEAVDSLSRIK